MALEPVGDRELEHRVGAVGGDRIRDEGTAPAGDRGPGFELPFGFELGDQGRDVAQPAPTFIADGLGLAADPIRDDDLGAHARYSIAVRSPMACTTADAVAACAASSCASETNSVS